ncbi:MAG TPA: hypothetical protein VFZ83_13315 [Acidimicrobiia bacterium]|nr:hypothetical protein [Acidimicrobiia bacterium]
MGTDLRIVRDDDAGSTTGLEVVAVQRAALRRSMVALEDAIAAPAGSGALAWSQRVHDALGEVARAWSVHTEVTEADGGLLDEIVQAAPRLANAVGRLRAEHGVIAEAIAEELALGGDITIGDDAAWIEQRREALTRLLGLLARHRQRGADLTYEAYDVDLGGME